MKTKVKKDMNVEMNIDVIMVLVLEYGDTLYLSGAEC